MCPWAGIKPGTLQSDALPTEQNQVGLRMLLKEDATYLKMAQISP